MFSFFNRKPKIIVDCFTCSDFAYEYTPIKKASRFLPEWWKNLPINKSSNSVYPHLQKTNMRHCYGFTELFKRGIIIPTWCESHIRVNENQVVCNPSKSNITGFESHNKELFEGGFKNYNHFKWHPPWLIKEKTGLHFLFTEATWLIENYPFTILPGVVEYNLNHTTAINFFFPKPQQSYDIYLPAGQPLVHIVPLIDDKNIEFKNHLIDNEEYNRLHNNCSMGLFGGYRSLRQLAKKNEEQSKCPFH